MQIGPMELRDKLKICRHSVGMLEFGNVMTHPNWDKNRSMRIGAFCINLETLCVMN